MSYGRPIQAGRMTDRVTIQRPSRDRGSSYGPGVQWSDDRTVWARVVSLRGEERVIAEAPEAVADWLVEIRDKPSGKDRPTAADRLRWEERFLEVVSVHPSDDGARVVGLMCREVEGVAG